LEVTLSAKREGPSSFYLILGKGKLVREKRGREEVHLWVLWGLTVPYLRPSFLCRESYGGSREGKEREREGEGRYSNNNKTILLNIYISFLSHPHRGRLKRGKGRKKKE